jgi:hypothetical protein
VEATYGVIVVACSGTASPSPYESALPTARLIRIGRCSIAAGVPALPEREHVHLERGVDVTDAASAAAGGGAANAAATSSAPDRSALVLISLILVAAVARYHAEDIAAKPDSQETPTPGRLQPAGG